MKVDDWNADLQEAYLRQPCLINKVTGRNHFRSKDSWIICFQLFCFHKHLVQNAHTIIGFCRYKLFFINC